MTDLHLGEAAILKQFLSDPEGSIAIRVFADSNCIYYAEKAKDAILSGNVKDAEKFAHYHEMYSALVPSLRDFAERQLKRAS